MFTTRVCLLGMLATARASSAPAPVEAPARYFRPGEFEAAPEDDQFVASWYSKHLRALREPALAALAGDGQAHAYRFLWLRTFDAPIALRVDVSPDGSGTLTVKAASGKGGYEPGTLVTNRRRVMPRAEVRRFLSGLATARYWELPTRERPEIEEDGSITVTADGAQWILEGVRSGRYHVVDRHSPEHGAYREAALWLSDRSDRDRARARAAKCLCALRPRLYPRLPTSSVSQIFLCKQCQGHPGAWAMVFARDLEHLHEEFVKNDALVTMPPTDMPWGVREMHVADPDGNVIRFGGGLRD